MGDILKNLEFFKRFGFDSSSQWIFYDERFQKFFDFFANNISDSNILTQYEVLERDELLQTEQFLGETERAKRLEQLEDAHPGLLQYTQADAQALEEELANVREAEEGYAVLVEDMRLSKINVNYSIAKLSENLNELAAQEKALLTTCQSKAKQLEELQRENLKLCKEASNCFAKVQSPPLFVHQLPLDQYFLKCDSFMHYFTMFIKENFKIENYEELKNNSLEMQQISAQLQTLENSFQYYTLAYIKERAKYKGTQSCIERLDVSLIHSVSQTDMERETRELELVNVHHLKNAYETLMHELTMHVKEYTRQSMELILLENTKEKLERALKRHEDDKRLSKIISDALSNAELIWISTQLDLEKIRNRFDNSDELAAETQCCLERTRAMRALQLNQPQLTRSAALIEQMAELLTQKLDLKVKNEPKSCFYEYEKFCRLVGHACQGMLSKKHYTTVLKQLSELERLDGILKPVVCDGAIEGPTFEPVKFLKPIFNAKMQQQKTEQKIRELRMLYQETITQRMDQEKLWRYSQLLWIWFLTEPKRILIAIEEVKKAAAKVPHMTGIKFLGGIKRKE